MYEHELWHIIQSVWWKRSWNVGIWWPGLVSLPKPLCFPFTEPGYSLIFFEFDKNCIGLENVDYTFNKTSPVPTYGNTHVSAGWEVRRCWYIWCLSRALKKYHKSSLAACSDITIIWMSRSNWSSSQHKPQLLAICLLLQSDWGHLILFFLCYSF